jgi:hypothetical protein
MKSLLVLLAASIVVLGQDNSAQKKSAPCEFQVAVTVSDSRAHEVMSDLTANSFLAKSGNAEVQPSSAERVSVGRVFIFLDVSRSVTMSSNSSDHLERITNELLTTIPEKTPVAVIPFAEQSTRIQQRSLVLPFLQKLRSSSGAPLGKRTRLYDVLVSVAETEKITLNDAVIVISDLDDRFSKTSRITAENKFKQLGSRPAVILLPSPVPATVEGQSILTDVQYFANNTAGFYMYLSGLKQNTTAILPPTFYAQALEYYRLTFPSGSLKDNRVKVAVLDSAMKKMPHVEIRSTNAFPECQH